MNDVIETSRYTMVWIWSGTEDFDGVEKVVDNGV